MDDGDEMKDRGMGFEGRREKKGEGDEKGENDGRRGKKERKPTVRSLPTDPTIQIRSAISPDKCSQLKITCQRERRST